MNKTTKLRALIERDRQYAVTATIGTFQFGKNSPLAQSHIKDSEAARKALNDYLDLLDEPLVT